VTLSIPHPNQIIEDILDLFNIFAPNVRELGFSLAV